MWNMFLALGNAIEFSYNLLIPLESSTYANMNIVHWTIENFTAYHLIMLFICWLIWLRWIIIWYMVIQFDELSPTHKTLFEESTYWMKWASWIKTDSILKCNFHQKILKCHNIFLNLFQNLNFTSEFWIPKLNFESHNWIGIGD